MRRIEQVTAANELSSLLQDLHGVEVTPCELLELEDYNYSIAHQRSSSLTTQDLSEINYDLGKAIGFIVGAVIGAFVLPGLGFGISGWFAGAVAGGAIGYRLASLFDGSGAPGRDSTLQDNTTRFSGAGELAILGSDIPIIYGNKDINPSGGVVVRSPSLIHSRITTGQGVQYLERLSLITIGRLGRVNATKTLFNDQQLTEVDALVETSPGTYTQKALGRIDNYSQCVNPQINTGVTLRKILTLKANAAARGAATTATNIVGCSGTGTAAIVKTAAGGAWNAGFDAASFTASSALGGYNFTRVQITGTAPITLAFGLSVSASTSTDPSTCNVHALISGNNWEIKELQFTRISGSSPLIVPNAELELRYYWRGAASGWAQLFVGTTELGRFQMNFNSLSFVPDYFLFSTGAGISATRSAGLVPALTSAGSVVPTLGTAFLVAAADIPKLQLGKVYGGGGGKFTIIGLDTATGLVTVNPEVWIADIAGWTGLDAWIASGTSLGEAAVASYTTSKAVQSIEIILEYSMWGRTSANALTAYAQGFYVDIVDSAKVTKRLGAYLINGQTDGAKTTTVGITNLPKAIYTVNLVPMDSLALTVAVDQIAAGSPRVALTASNTVGGNTITMIVERVGNITAAAARTLLNVVPASSSSDRQPAIQLGSINEIVNPFGMLTGLVTEVAPGTGTGLDATYYNRSTTIAGNPAIVPALITRTEPTVNMNTSTLTGVPGLTPTSFYVVWEGVITPRYSGINQFRIFGEDGFRLIVNDVLVINSYNFDIQRDVIGQISLLAGVEYRIRLEYFNQLGQGICRLDWQVSPYHTWRVVEQTQLKPGVPSGSNQDLPAPTYPGYTIGRTKLTSSDRLSSAPQESFDVELGAVIRQYLGYGVATAVSTNGVVTDNKAPFSTVDIPIYSMVQVLGKGIMMLTTTPTNTTLTCTSYTGSAFAATNESVLVIDFPTWQAGKPGMSITGAGIPAGTFVDEFLPGNRVTLVGPWGRSVKATIVGAPTTSPITLNASVSVAVGDELVVFNMGSSPYFPDQFVDRLINPVSGMGNYINENYFIDYKAIVYARRFCKDNQFFSDVRIANQKFEQWAIAGAPASLLFCTEYNGRYALIPQEDSRPIYLFNDSNSDVREPGVPFTDQLTNTLLVKYQDRLGREKQIKIQTAAANTDPRTEVVKTITAPGVTNRNQAIRVGQVALKSLIIQGTVIEITTDVAVGLYVPVGSIVRTQHRAIEYSGDSSGFVMGASPSTNSRSTNRAIPIDRIEGMIVILQTRHELVPDPANPGRTLESLAITGASDSQNNISLPNTTTIIDPKRISISSVVASTGGTLTATRMIIDQQIVLSQPVTITANSRLVVTHRGSRLTESDLLVTQISPTTINVIGLTEPIAVGDAWAIGTQSTYYKVWRISGTKPDILANKIVFSGVAWSPDILSASGLVTVG